MKYLFWGLVIAAALLIVAFLVREVMRVRWAGRAKKVRPGKDQAPDWRPQEARARLLLAQADELAAQGLYAEAAHHLLLHSIQDVEDHRPRAIRPALTARDIAAPGAVAADAPGGLHPHRPGGRAQPVRRPAAGRLGLRRMPQRL